MATLRPGDTSPEQFEDDLDDLKAQCDALSYDLEATETRLRAAEAAIGRLIEVQRKYATLFHDFMLEIHGSRIGEIYSDARQLHYDMEQIMNPYKHH